MQMLELHDVMEYYLQPYMLTGQRALDRPISHVWEAQLQPWKDTADVPSPEENV